MKAILAIDGVSRVIEISHEEFMQGYIDIIYREPFITKASKNEGCAVDNSTEAIKIRAFHHNAYIGNTPLFEAEVFKMNTLKIMHPDGSTHEAVPLKSWRQRCRCECKDHGPCEHDFSGPVVYTENSGSVVCRHCGLSAMAHDIKLF